MCICMYHAMHGAASRSVQWLGITTSYVVYYNTIRCLTVLNCINLTISDLTEVHTCMHVLSHYSA